MLGSHYGVRMHAGCMQAACILHHWRLHASCMQPAFFWTNFGFIDRYNNHVYHFREVQMHCGLPHIFRGWCTHCSTQWYVVRYNIKTVQGTVARNRPFSISSTSRREMPTLFSATIVYLRNLSGVARRMYSSASVTCPDSSWNVTLRCHPQRSISAMQLTKATFDVVFPASLVQNSKLAMKKK